MSTPSVDDLVEAMMVSAGSLNVLLSHMAQFSRECERDRVEESEPVPIVLRRLLRGTLAPLADCFALADILTATRVINHATAIAEREIFMVAPELVHDDDEDED